MLTSRVPEGDANPHDTRVSRPGFAFSMFKLGMTVDVGQRLMEAVLVGPVGDMMHIQESIYHLLCRMGNFYIQMEDPWHPR